MKLIKVKWRDSRMYITQHEGDTDWSVCTITSVGLVVEDTKDHITLAGDVLEDGDLRRVIVIPKENIIK